MTTPPSSPSDRGRHRSPPADTTAAGPVSGPTTGPGTAPAAPPARREGPAAAALLAAGIGVFTLGLLTTLAEASGSFSDWLALTDSVGPLSGKTTYAVIVWLVAWVILHVTVGRRATVSRPVMILTAILVGLGVIGTFPIFFQMFATE